MKPSRNDPCPCGSGRKYKKCCGADNVNAIDADHKKHEHFITEDVPSSADIPEFSEDFFNKLDTTEICAHKLLYSCILRPEVEAVAAKLTNATIDRGKSEAELIRKCRTTSDLIILMKNGLDNLNHILMKSRLLENPSEAVNLLLNELKSSTRDDFVELAVKTIAEAGIDISEELKEIIEKHNRPAYQISVLCLLLGFYDNPVIPQFLWNYFCYFRSHYSKENYWRGPFYGLWEYWANKKYGRDN